MNQRSRPLCIASPMSPAVLQQHPVVHGLGTQLHRFSSVPLEKVKDFLRENPDIAKDIEAKIRANTMGQAEAKAEAANVADDVEPIFKEEL